MESPCGCEIEPPGSISHGVRVRYKNIYIWGLHFPQGAIPINWSVASAMTGDSEYLVTYNNFLQYNRYITSVLLVSLYYVKFLLG